MKKTVSFAIIHMCVAFTVGFVMSGDIWVGGTLALVEPMCNTVAFYFHEKVWNRFAKRPSLNDNGVTGDSVLPA